ncbi:hypothetical protein GCM10008174_18370 [Methylopila turkensis]|uniref:Uncharacterized protein n=1 Tax=Methylopila turkensis TaxID=1437816 RepID=A0A9W6N783_9HYPH|nr:hypothetical protein GCM10008174_18370 [Methylopila turkensis]
MIRHHTSKPGARYATLFDLWRNDAKGFARYQATQTAGRKLFRERRLWAAFVCPAPNETMFVGLFDAELSATRKADWLCDYRGDAPGGGEAIDLFATVAMIQAGPLVTVGSGAPPDVGGGASCDLEGPPLGATKDIGPLLESGPSSCNQAAAAEPEPSRRTPFADEKRSQSAYRKTMASAIQSMKTRSRAESCPARG